MQFTTRVTGVPLAMMLMASAAMADDRLEQAEAVAKSKGCFECHGKSGNTFSESEPPVPVIAAQSVAYLKRALEDYRSGARSGTIMTTLMGNRTDEEIQLLAEHYAAQERY